LRILLDTNVVLDVLAERQPWVDDSAAVLSLCESGRLEGFVAAHGVTTLHYLLVKYRGQARAAAAMVDLVGVLRVAAVDHETVLQALALGRRDFEDAVQAVAALRAGVTHLVTRNPGDFGSLGLRVLTPGELLALAA
jgi:predicted nucleic acid-binding protein